MQDETKNYYRMSFQPGFCKDESPACHSTNTGARLFQQDFGMSYSIGPTLELIVVADGHTKGNLEDVSMGTMGYCVAKILVMELKNFIVAKVSQHQDGLAGVGDVALDELLKKALEKACDVVDESFSECTTAEVAKHCMPGSTVTAVLVDTCSNRFAVLQLGDSFAMLVDATTGELKWTSKEQVFTDPDEINRYAKAELPVVTEQRKHTSKQEKRVSAYVDTEWGPIVLPEPSGGVECRAGFPESVIQLQRRPDVKVLPLPLLHGPLALLVGSDGFFSKNALDKQRLAQLLVNPTKWLRSPLGSKDFNTSELVCGTELQRFWMMHPERWSSKGYSEEESEAGMNCCIQKWGARARFIAPGKRWRSAMDRAFDDIVTSGVLNEGPEVTLLLNRQAALDAAVRTPTVLLGDDNVTAVLLVLERNVAEA